MKKIKQLSVLAIIIAFTSLNVFSSYARVWRVNALSNYNLASQIYGDNFGGTAANPVFNDLASAQTGVQDHDTLYLEGCPVGTAFPGIVLTKPLVIIGTGYFLTQNTNTSSDNLVSYLDNIYFNPGSEGSQLIGVYISSTYQVQVNTGNITIKRCYINVNTEIFVNQNVQNVTIAQNFFDNTTSTASAITFSNYGGPGNGLIIKNNIFKKPLWLAYGSTTVYSAAKCENNVFDCPSIAGVPSVKMHCGSFKNNIIKNASNLININDGTPSNKVSYNSIAGATQLDTAAAFNNKYVSNMSNLFVSPPSSPDGLYRLKATSAVNYPGSDGAPRGAFGGAAVTSRYALSGNAAIPVIYDITTTGVATQSGGLPVTIKARTIK